MSIRTFATCALLLCPLASAAVESCADGKCDQDDHTSLMQLNKNTEIGTERDMTSSKGPIGSADRITCGSDFTCAASDARFACWGNNAKGQLGLGNTDDTTSPPALSAMVSLGNSQVAAGARHTCAIMTGANVGKIKCWGDNNVGQLGVGNNLAVNAPQTGFTNLGTNVKVTKLAAGDEHTCGITTTHQVKCWGHGGSGRLGNGNTVNIGDGANEMGDTIGYISLGGGRTAKSLALGAAHTCVLLDTDIVKCFGDNTYGQLGYGNTNSVAGTNNQMGDSLAAVPLGNSNGSPFTAKMIVAGGTHTCAILHNDMAKCWGRNDKGQLGYGNTATKASIGSAASSMGDDLPIIDLGTQEGVATKYPVLALVAGAKHTCAIVKGNASPASGPAEPNRVKCWGHNNYGQLGYESTEDKGDQADEMGADLGGVALGTGSVAVSLEAGDSHTCALLTDNSMKCWGWNSKGQLGRGNTDNVGDDSNEMSSALTAVAAPTTTTATTTAAP